MGKGIGAVLAGACAVMALNLAPTSASAAEQQAYAAAMNYATPVGPGRQGRQADLQQPRPARASTTSSSDEGEFKSKADPRRREGAGRRRREARRGHLPLPLLAALLDARRGPGSRRPAPRRARRRGRPTLDGANTPLGAVNAAPDPIDLWPQADQEPLGKGDWPFYGKDLANSRDGGTHGPVASRRRRCSGRRGASTRATATSPARRSSRAGWWSRDRTRGTVYALDAPPASCAGSSKLGDEPINGSVAVARRPRLRAGRASRTSRGSPRSTCDTGKLLWKQTLDRQKDSDAYGAPVVWSGTVYIGDLRALRRDGRPRGERRAARRRARREDRQAALEDLHGPEEARRRLGVDHAGDRPQDAAACTSARATPTTRPRRKTTDAMVALDARTGKIAQPLPGDRRRRLERDRERRRGARLRLRRLAQPDRRARRRRSSSARARSRAPTGRSTARRWTRSGRLSTGPGAQVGGIVGSTASDGERIYGPDTLGGENWALDNDGSLKWVSSDGGPLHFNPTSVANGVVYTTDMNGYLTARDATTGALLAKIPLGSPTWGGVVDRRRLGVRRGRHEGGTGYIVAYRPRKDAATGSRAAATRRVRATATRTRSEAARRSGTRARTAGSATGTRATATASRSRSEKKQGQGQARSTAAARAMTATSTASMRDHRPRPGRRPGQGPRAPRRPLRAEAAGHDGEAQLLLRPVHRPAGPGHEPRRPRAAARSNGFMLSVEPSMRRVDRLVRAEPPGGAHPPRALVRGSTRATRRTTTSAATPSGSSATATRRRRATSGARQRRRPERARLRRSTSARGKPQPMIYMLHNKTAQPLDVYIVLDVDLQPRHARAAQGEDGPAAPRRRRRAVRPHLRRPAPARRRRQVRVRDEAGRHRPARQRGLDRVDRSRRTTARSSAWAATCTPAACGVVVENYGSEENPCRDDGRGYGGTLLLQLRRALPQRAAVRGLPDGGHPPGWRAPDPQGRPDPHHAAPTRTRTTPGTTVMTHLGIYIDEQQPPRGGCKPKVDQRRRRGSPIDGRAEPARAGHDGPLLRRALRRPAVRGAEDEPQPARGRRRTA